MRDLLANVYYMLQEQRRLGYQDGRNLLAGMASGTYSIDDFNKYEVQRGKK